MSPRTLASVSIFLLLAAAVAILSLRGPEPPPPTAPPAEEESGSPRAPGGVPPTAHPVMEQAATLNSPDTTPQDDLSTLEVLLEQYRRAGGNHPSGENEEIAAALLGRNPGRVAYLPPAGPFLDARGRIIDRWGTPWFFHSLSATRTEIRSAGPDRELWTDDDLLLETGR